MFRTTDIILIAAMVSAAAFTYTTKHKVEGQLAEVRRIEAKIRFEEDSLTILKADWSLLTQPARLQKLTEIYASQLELALLLEPTQILAGVAELPARPLENLDVDGQSQGVLAKDATDNMTTSGVPQ